MATGTIKSNRVTGQYVTTAYISPQIGWVVFKLPKFNSLSNVSFTVFGLDGDKTSFFTEIGRDKNNGIYIANCTDTGMRGYYARMEVTLS